MRADARPRTTSRGRRRRRRSSASSRWPWIANDASARPAPALPAGRRGHPHAHAHETTHRPTHSTHPLVYIERSMFRFPVIKCLNELIQARESTGTRCRRSNSPRMLAICLRRPPLVCVRHWRESRDLLAPAAAGLRASLARVKWHRVSLCFTRLVPGELWAPWRITRSRRDRSYSTAGRLRPRSPDLSYDASAIIDDSHRWPLVGQGSSLCRPRSANRIKYYGVEQFNQTPEILQK